MNGANCLSYRILQFRRARRCSFWVGFKGERCAFYRGILLKIAFFGIVPEILTKILRECLEVRGTAQIAYSPKYTNFCKPEGADLFLLGWVQWIVLRFSRRILLKIAFFGIIPEILTKILRECLVVK